MITLAPSTASLRAISRPMPPVEPVTRADLSFSCRSMTEIPLEYRRRLRKAPIGRSDGDVFNASASLDLAEQHAFSGSGQACHVRGAAIGDGRVSTVSQHVAGDLVLPGEPDALLALGVGEEAVEGPHSACVA